MPEKSGPKSMTSDAAGASYYSLYHTVKARDLKRIPQLIIDIIESKSWKQWRWIGNDFGAASLDVYLESPPPKGIGIGVEMFRRLIQDNNRARDMFDKARKATQAHGGDHCSEEYLESNLYNVQDAGTDKAPTGNTVDATIRRLRKHHPEIHARWLAGELSANAAAIEAGFRKKPTHFDQIMRLLPKLTDEERRAVHAATG